MQIYDKVLTVSNSPAINTRMYAITTYTFHTPLACFKIEMLQAWVDGSEHCIVTA